MPQQALTIGTRLHLADQRRNLSPILGFSDPVPCFRLNNVGANQDVDIMFRPVFEQCDCFGS